MQVVIPLVAQIDYTELRYALRSFEKYLDDFEVTLVGTQIPDWITGVEQISVPDIAGQKQLSIKRKVMAALHCYDEIFYSADDCFLLKHCVANNFPYFYDGILGKHNLEGGAGPLKKQLEALGKTIYNFDCHYPVVYRRDFIEVTKQFCSNCLVKSAYLNFIAVPAVAAKDAKIVGATQEFYIEKFTCNLPSFSSNTASLRSLMPFLRKNYPEPSRFELYE
jgi:hypothetical protein